jgi:hypothetical protein
MTREGLRDEDSVILRIAYAKAIDLTDPAELRRMYSQTGFP